MRWPCPLLAAVFLLLSTCAAAPASAQIRRCVSADGSHVYTDRECRDLGAIERAPQPGAARAGSHAIRRDCSRSVRDLVFELTAAIDARDVNRLAGLYHWPGTSTRGAQAIMGRLDAVANRPLVGVSELEPPPATTVEAPAWQSVPYPAPAQPPAASPPSPPDAAGAANPATRPPARRTPTGIVVDQTMANGITPLQTVFSLRRHLDCWWLSL